MGLQHKSTGSTMTAGEYVAADGHNGHAQITMLVVASDCKNVGEYASALVAGKIYVCDGTADEVQINAAIAALPTVNGRVLLTEGTFYCDAQIAINAKNNVLIQGAGNATLIKQNAKASLFTNDSVLYAVDSQNPTFRDIQFQGRNTKTWSTTLSANATGTDTTITVASNSGMVVGDAIGIQDDTGAAPHLTTITNIDGTTITLNDAIPAGTPFATSGKSVYAMDDALYLLNIANSPGSRTYNCLFVNSWGGAKSTGGHERAALNITQNVDHVVAFCRFASCGNWGLQVGGGSPRCTDIKIIGCHAVNGRIEAGFKVYNADHVTLSGCTTENNAEAGVSIESGGSDCEFVTVEGGHFSGDIIGIEAYNVARCTFVNNTIDTTDTYDGIQLMSGAGGNIVAGNQIKGAARDGVFCKTPNTIIANNAVYSSTQAGIHIQNADGCKVMGNVVIDADSGNTSTYSGIEVEADEGDTSNNTYIFGNTSITGTPGSYTTYGVKVTDARCTGTVILGNLLTPCKVGAISDSGTSTVTAWPTPANITS